MTLKRNEDGHHESLILAQQRGKLLPSEHWSPARLDFSLLFNPGTNSCCKQTDDVSTMEEGVKLSF